MPGTAGTVTTPVTYDRREMAERGRRGGLAKAERARPAVVLTGAEAAALVDAYRLLGEIAARTRGTNPDRLATDRPSGIA